MNIIDKIFNRLPQEQAPDMLKAKILSMAKAKDTLTEVPKRKVSWYGLFKPVLALVLLLVLATGVYWQFFRVPNLAAAFELKPEVIDVAGVPVDGAFIIKSSKSINSFQLKRAIKFDPEIDFSVSSLGNNTFRIKPKGDLTKDTIYKIQIMEGVADHDYTWAYQVKAPFQVLGTTPSDKSSYVPADSAIQITFNREKLKSPEQYFEISPNVEGRFEQYGTLLSFIPKHPYKDGQIYTVTVKKGLAVEGSDETLAEDKVIKFEVNSGSSSYNYLNIYDDFREYATGNVSFQVYANDSVKKLQAKVYSFANPTDFTDSYQKSRDWENGWAYYSVSKRNLDFSTVGGKLVSDNSIDLKQQDYQSYIELPQKLAPGLYAIDLKGATPDEHIQVWAEVTPIAHYGSFTADNSLVWLMDFNKKQPITKANITALSGTKLGQPDNDGLTQFATPEEFKKHISRNGPWNYYYSAPNFLRVDADGYSPYFILANGSADLGSPYYQGEKYWRHFSTERPLYQMADDVKFFGAVKPRDGSSLEGKQLTVGIYNNVSYYDIESLKDTPPLKTVTVTVGKGGVYQGDISYDGLTPGYYTLASRDGNNLVDTTSFNVLAYSKPIYQLTFTPEHDSYFSGETITYNISAKFFDGTPVPNMQLKYTGYWNAEVSGIVTTDDNGNAKAQLSLPYIEDQNTPGYGYGYYGSSWPRSFYATLTPVKEEEGLITASSNVTVFGPRISLTGSSSVQEDGKNTFTAHIEKVVPKKETLPNGSSYSYYGSEPLSGQGVRAEIIKVTYTKNQTGEYYDYITNTVIPQYTYDRHEETIEQVNGTTDQKGEWSFDKRYEFQEDTQYEIHFSSTDSAGITVRSVVWYTYRSGLAVPVEAPAPNVEIKNDDYMPEIHFKNKDAKDDQYSGTFSVKEDYAIELGYTNANASKDKRLVLFYSYQTKIFSAQVSTETTYKDSFKNEYKPSVNYRAVVLGPRGFEETYDLSANFQVKDVQLKTEIKPDKETYRPGDKVTLNLEVKDKDGNGASADVNVAVVDEAVFALNGGYGGPDPLNDLYRYNIVSPVTTFTRYDRSDVGGGGKGGGGGGDGVRTDFKDTAYFDTVHVGSSGKTAISFTLPDNVTAWRATAQAVNMDTLQAGLDTKPVVVSLPLFVDATVAPTYLVGDEPKIRVRVFGNAYKAGQKTTFTLESKELGVSFSKETTDSSVYVPLPKLTAGKFSLVVHAEQNGNKDALQRTSSVVTSYFQVPVTKQVTVANGKPSIDIGAHGLVHVTFTDTSKGQYYGDLVNLLYNTSVRVEGQTVHYAAHNALEQLFNEPDDNANLDLSQFTQTTGGLSLVSYGDADLRASALVAVAAPDAVPSSKLIMYFNGTLNDKATDVHRISQALLGLAALNQPVLAKTQAFASDPNLTTEDKLYVASALALMGDKEGARALYTKDIKSQLQSNDKGSYVPDSLGDRQIRLTTHAAWLAADLKENEFGSLWKYVQNNYPQKEINWIEKLMALKAYMGNAKVQPISFSYHTSNSNRGITLEKGSSDSFDMFADELKTMEFSGVKGSASMLVSFEESVDPQSMNRNANVSIKRTYIVNGKETTTWKSGDVVQIKLQPTVSDPKLTWGYEITDFLPSGLKLLTPQFSAYDFGSYDPCAPRWWYPNQVSGNEVKFTTYRSDERCKNQIVPITYIARVVSAGTFKADPATVAPIDEPTKVNASQSQTIQIKE